MDPEIRSFWDRTRSELRAVDPAPAVEPAPDQEYGPFAVHLVTLSSFEGRRIRGRYYVPHDRPHRGRLAALLTAPGYGGFNMTPPPVHMAVAGFAVLALFPRYHGLSEEERRLPHGTKLTYGVTDRERFSYRGGYMDCIRGVDFLTSRPEVDPERIGMWGASQAGGLTLATAALDTRVAAAVADLPFLCNYPVAIDVADGPYGELNRYAQEHPSQRARMLETLAHFDPLTLASEIACPTLISVGLRDRTCPPATIRPVFDRIRALKAMIVYPERAHTGDTDFFQHALAWMQRYLAV